MSTKDLPEITFKEFYHMCKASHVSLPSFVLRYIAQLERKVKELEGNVESEHQPEPATPKPDQSVIDMCAKNGVTAIWNEDERCYELMIDGHLYGTCTSEDAMEAIMLVKDLKETVDRQM